MQVNHLLEESSIAGKFVAELRDVNVQKDRMRFRRNIERLGEVLGYELSKQLSFSEKNITTPLGNSKIQLPESDVVICSILRAGLPLHNGLLNYFDDAENSFISAYRHHPNNDEHFEIVVEYLASPSLEGKTLILADPMLATGKSFVNVMKALKQMGTPKEIHLVAVIGAEEGVALLEKEFPKDSKLWIATIDKELNDHGYILPGLGDAGDLCYGGKMQH
ncbi:uracil phosphoribosyltransferase [Salegentibacter maritimus]|uniref:uracil phosphoribosyltransferase n=1 Tax=Salegentibacter maritimus TaxID=2794347 RepID=UPI0018E44DB0|nr:uracil phosphoribosyltransferase [Salegentibacter maritimus]MBI6115201.1 uracil phosphoribosyltransferase [Salegentibacter maritimus]